MAWENVLFTDAKNDNIYPFKMIIMHSKLFNNQRVTSRGCTITTHPARGIISNIMVVIFPIKYITFNRMLHDIMMMRKGTLLTNKTWGVYPLMLVLLLFGIDIAKLPIPLFSIPTTIDTTFYHGISSG